jgi:hypothetical protein
LDVIQQCKEEFIQHKKDDIEVQKIIWLQNNNFPLFFDNLDVKYSFATNIIRTMWEGAKAEGVKREGMKFIIHEKVCDIFVSFMFNSFTRSFINIFTDDSQNYSWGRWMLKLLWYWFSYNQNKLDTWCLLQKAF